MVYMCRPDTSRRQRRRLPPLPLAIALVPLKCSSRNLQFPHRVPFAKEKMPWCPCPFKNEAYSPDKWIIQNRAEGKSRFCTITEEENEISLTSMVKCVFTLHRHERLLTEPTTGPSFIELLSTRNCLNHEICLDINRITNQISNCCI